jgi:hypothetical protein
VKRWLILAMMVSPLCSATLERLSLDEMIAKSTSIVRGTVSDSWAVFNGRDIFTHYKIQVDEGLKGPAQKSVEVTVPGGVYGNYHQTPSGSPVLNKGDQYIFFLWTSKAGVTWITGMTQGLFTVDRSSDPVATRTASRELMLDAATARPVKDSAVSLKMSDLRARIAAKAGPGGVQ